MSKKKFHSFSDLEVIEDMEGNISITTKEEAAKIKSESEKRDVEYLDASIDVLNASKEKDNTNWPTADTVANKRVFVNATVFLEGFWLSDALQAHLREKGHTVDWLANQGLMLQGARLFGVSKDELIIRAKCCNSDGELEHPRKFARKDIHEYSSDEIDDIWVWEGTEEKGEWRVHPELVSKYKYNDLTDLEESAAIEHYRKFAAKAGWTLLTGFSIVKSGVRYCMAVKNFDLDGNKSDPLDMARSIWNPGNGQIAIGYPCLV